MHLDPFCEGADSPKGIGDGGASPSRAQSGTVPDSDPEEGGSELEGDSTTAFGFGC